MIFGPVDLDDPASLGAVLAHAQHIASRVVPKGTILTQALAQELRAAGLARVVAARLQAEDVAENHAATLLGEALTGPGMQAASAQHGRVNLHARVHGLFRAAAATVTALNSVHEAITLATLPDALPVAPGDLLATVKIIPFAVPRDALTQAIAQAGDQPPLRLAPFRPLRAGIVATRVRGMKESLIVRALATTEGRVRALGGAALPSRVVPHESEPVAAALRALLAQGADLLLVAGGSATVDRADEVPAGICAAGGEIRHFGMPVDPGNLICLGRIGAVPALVLPGCARSPALNGIDFCLTRLFAGETLDGAAMAAMGFGGLLKDFAGRPVRRSRQAREAAAATPDNSAIANAAGHDG